MGLGVAPDRRRTVPDAEIVMLAGQCNRFCHLPTWAPPLGSGSQPNTAQNARIPSTSTYAFPLDSNPLAAHRGTSVDQTPAALFIRVDANYRPELCAQHIGCRVETDRQLTLCFVDDRRYPVLRRELSRCKDHPARLTGCTLPPSHLLMTDATDGFNARNIKRIV